MPFGIGTGGGFGGGHGGVGGPGGFGGPGGPGFGGPGGPGFGGPGGFFGGFFGLGHFGPSGNFSASSPATGNKPAIDLNDGFPESVMTARPANIPSNQPLTAQNRVEVFIINANSIERARRWLYAITAFACLVVILTAALFSNFHWSWLILASPGIIPSVISYAIRNTINECYGRPTANCFCFITSIASLLSTILALFIGGSPRATLAYVFGFLIGGLISNWAYQVAWRSQVIRGFEDSNKTYRARCASASIAGRSVELLIFAPLAFAGYFSFFDIIWLGICTFGLTRITEIILSPLTCLTRDLLTYQLSAKNDYIES